MATYFNAYTYSHNLLMAYNINHIEAELKHRWNYKYQWFRKQEDIWDKRSRFIYNTKSWEALVLKMKHAVETYGFEKRSFFYYTINRWYNFWSAKAIEQLFCNHTAVTPEANKKHKHIDFYINKTPFDHKTTVFPKGFGHTLDYAINHEEELISWLYEHQSRQGRLHYKNRLFVIMYAKDNAHWKLKAKLNWLKPKITEFLNQISESSLYEFQFEDNYKTKSRILWAIE